ncbi:MAG TPA: energy-coupling factor transporter transmembrane component T [Kouleothrix sp.]|uniref:energy-coupling factor transporter transmembrane component T n=1 Tax=Kouleothrix sp. TaxID=2779161 RepID=UPI002BC2D6F7|nr:energy-coupling factor transporter transmembrane component T [Kouleothrix sp.]HRC75442.1 energy-coupling factor transporter transmembrane component T [Kouleothrix sp.]
MQSSYFPGTSVLHRLHPLTKLAAAALILAATYLLPGALTPLLLFALVAALAASAGVASSILRTVARVVLPVSISLFLIQGILFPPAGATPLPLGPITLTREGLLFAYLISMRLVVLSAVVLLLLRVTHPADLVYALTQRGLPRSIGYILLVSVQIVPDMSARATAILEAQRSRGLETQRGFFRVRGIVPLIGPLVVGALVDVEERAMALESRAYTAPGPKTSLRQLFDTPAQRAARVLLLLALLALIGWRLYTVFA